MTDYLYQLNRGNNQDMWWWIWTRYWRMAASRDCMLKDYYEWKRSQSQKNKSWMWSRNRVVASTGPWNQSAFIERKNSACRDDPLITMFILRNLQLKNIAMNRNLIHYYYMPVYTDFAKLVMRFIRSSTFF